jgi:hypothetical protein
VLVTVFFATVMVTLPSPTLTVDGTLMKASFVAGAHAQPGGAVTVSVAGPPSLEIVTVAGAIDVTQTEPPACVNDTVWPAIVTLPDRAPPALGARDNVAWPPSVPDEPLATTMKLSREAAVQVQPEPAVTRTMIVVVPPAESKAVVPALTEKVHDVGGVGPVGEVGVVVGGAGVAAVAPCVKSSVDPATTSVAERAAWPVFAERFTCTVPLPLPLLPDATCANEALLVAVQVQPAVVDTAIDTEPALEGRSVRPELPTEYEQGAALGCDGELQPTTAAVTATMSGRADDRTNARRRRMQTLTGL